MTMPYWQCAVVQYPQFSVFGELPSPLLSPSTWLPFATRLYCNRLRIKAVRSSNCGSLPAKLSIASINPGVRQHRRHRRRAVSPPPAAVTSPVSVSVITVTPPILPSSVLASPASRCHVSEAVSSRPLTTGDWLAAKLSEIASDPVTNDRPVDTDVSPVPGRRRARPSQVRFLNRQNRQSRSSAHPHRPSP